MPIEVDNEDFKIARTYGTVIAFPISRRDIPVCGDGEIIEAIISRVSDALRKYAIYLTYNASARRVFASLAQVNPVEGESFRIERMRKYRIEELVLDYQAKRPKGLENTELSKAGDVLIMNLPGFSFELAQARLRTVRGILIVDARLPQEEGEIVISKKLDEIKVGLKGEEKSPITSVTFAEGFLLMTYQTTHDPFPHLRRISTKLWEKGARSELDGQSPDLNESCGERPDLMTTREIRGWIDGEGYLNPGKPGKNGPYLAVTQKERAPLHVMEKTLWSMGILSRVYYHPSNDSHVLKVSGWENLARVIAEVGPFRTAIRNAQVEEFKRNLAMPRKKTHASTRRARRTLGIS